ncbi:MFS transporter [Rhodovibrio salinarum]|uniref:MFS transporter n=1 Tax=Rhodovibrio salinarum TaxID=1087 RepID=A0A934QFS1_9PROT|nr:MFS transporter [Rhodovibrio salinarum]MBK1695822.1 MFS transporter [Rhodovibrio salinarum]
MTQSANQTGVSPARVTLRAILTVFLPFAGGYYLSYLYRSVNAVIADTLTADVGLSASDLGLLTSAYFVAFSAFQIPLGLLLDRYGARRVHGLLLLLAAAGALGFALGEGLLQLWLARALIGLGVAGGLMAALKAITQWFPEHRWPVVNGCFLAMGGVGAMSATAPVEWLLQVTDWRGIFAGLAAATLAVAVLILSIVPDRRDTHFPQSLSEQLTGVRHVFADRFFWRLAPMAFLCMATSLSIQGLWAGPWLRDVAGFDHAGVAQTLFMLAAAVTVGYVFWGTVADWLSRHGVPLTRTLGMGVALFLTALGCITFELDRTALWPWLFLGLMGNVTALSYTVVSRHFPLALSGRATTALNLLVFLGAFGVQSAIGGIIDLVAAGQTDPYPAAAYQVAFATFLALCLLAWLWYLLAARFARA